MKLSKLIFGFALVASIAGVAQAERLIRFGSDATYPPFEYTATNGEVIGFDIDLAKAMCAHLKAKCTFVNQDWDGIIPALQSRKFDVIASSMSHTPERAKVISFTQKIWSTPNSLLAKEGSTLSLNKESLKGKTIGVQQGTIQDKYATKYFTETTIKRYKNGEDSYNDLKVGRIDAVFADGGISRDFLNSNKDLGFSIVSEISEEADPEIFGKGTAFAVRKKDKQLLKDLNTAFDAIRANGTYEKIANKYFDYDIYGSKKS